MKTNEPISVFKQQMEAHVYIATAVLPNTTKQYDRTHGHDHVNPIFQPRLTHDITLLYHRIE